MKVNSWFQTDFIGSRFVSNLNRDATFLRLDKKCFSTNRFFPGAVLLTLLRHSFANDVYFTLYVKAVPTARAPNKLINWTNYRLH